MIKSVQNSLRSINKTKKNIQHCLNNSQVAEMDKIDTLTHKYMTLHYSFMIISVFSKE